MDSDALAEAFEAASRALYGNPPLSARARAAWLNLTAPGVRAAAPHIERAALLKAADEIQADGFEPGTPISNRNIAEWLRDRAARVGSDTTEARDG